MHHARAAAELVGISHEKPAEPSIVDSFCISSSDRSVKSLIRNTLMLATFHCSAATVAIAQSTL
jgi:hypothetical protein